MNGDGCTRGSDHLNLGESSEGSVEGSDGVRQAFKNLSHAWDGRQTFKRSNQFLQVRQLIKELRGMKKEQGHIRLVQLQAR
jgi:hypothetical protein